MTHTVYIVRCNDDTLYTGYTTDIQKRLVAHNASRYGAKYTRARRPVTLVYTEKHASLRAALRREAFIKKLPKKDKLELIERKQ